MGFSTVTASYFSWSECSQMSVEPKVPAGDFEYEHVLSDLDRGI
jgi:hypothetical protein